MMLRVLFALIGVFFLPASVLSQERPLAAEATATKPLEKGVNVPDVKLTDLDGKSVALSALYRQKPLVLVFFRGGWCPVCTKHTGQLSKIYPQLQAAGYEMIGISPDSVDNSKANVEKAKIPFAIYSDSQLDATRGFGLAFKVDEGTVSKYKGFGIDLEKASGQTHHGLPIPAVYVVNQKGLITFAHSNADYRQRLDVNDLLKAIGR
jgi:peroxiredoxin